MDCDEYLRKKPGFFGGWGRVYKIMGFRLLFLVNPPLQIMGNMELQTISNAGEIKGFNAHSGHYAAAVTFHFAKGIYIPQHIG